MIKDEITPTKPFLRWAGGKRWLIKYLPDILPQVGYKNYHEPFLGGAAIFFSIGYNHLSFLSDLNEELINCFLCLKNDLRKVLRYLSKYDNTESFYYSLRDLRTDNLVEKAAIFIFLNQTSFNGIYRVNNKGEYNVPYGYRTKAFFDKKELEIVSSRLQKAQIFSSDFSLIKKNIKKHDLIFLDPPYTISHNLNGFIKYNQKLFSLEDQYKLSDLIDDIKRKNAYYVLTNAAHFKIAEIFDKKDRRIEFNRSNIIGGTSAKRGQTSEYVFTNCK